MSQGGDAQLTTLREVEGGGRCIIRKGTFIQFHCHFPLTPQDLRADRSLSLTSLGYITNHSITQFNWLMDGGSELHHVGGCATDRRSIDSTCLGKQVPPCDKIASSPFNN